MKKTESNDDGGSGDTFLFKLVLIYFLCRLQYSHMNNKWSSILKCTTKFLIVFLMYEHVYKYSIASFLNLLRKVWYLITDFSLAIWISFNEIWTWNHFVLAIRWGIDIYARCLWSFFIYFCNFLSSIYL